MATVRVRIDDFEDGLLPGICAATGAPAERTYRVEATSKAPAWIWLFLFAFPWGLVVIAVLGRLLRTSTTGYVPFTPAHRALVSGRIRTAAWATVIAAAVAVGSLLLVAASSASAFRSLGLLGMGGAVLVAVLGYFLWLNPPGSVGMTIDGTGRWVELDNASPAFVAAYEAQEAQRRAERRAAIAATSPEPYADR